MIGYIIDFWSGWMPRNQFREAGEWSKKCKGVRIKVKHVWHILYTVFLSRLIQFAFLKRGGQIWPQGLDLVCFSEVRILFVSGAPSSKEKLFFRPVGGPVVEAS